MINILSNHVNPKLCKQVWYADDSSSAGKLLEIRSWWDELNLAGPKFGYFPKPSKTVLILKDDSSLVDRANEIFGDTEIVITTEGERHLGAVIGSNSFREFYIKKKVDS